MKFFWTFTLFFLLGFWACNTNSTKTTSNGNMASGSIYERLEVQPFQEKLIRASNPQLVDVRTPEEFSAGKIPNSVNVNFYDDNFAEQMNQFNKDLPLFLYCQSGGRSQKAAEKLKNWGFKEIYELRNGFSSWEQ